MADMEPLLQVDEPGGLAARWNFTGAIGSPMAAPGGIGAAAIVTYSFMQALPDYEMAIDHPGFRAFDPALDAAARAALAAWAAVCNIGFVEVPDAGQGGEIPGLSHMALALGLTPKSLRCGQKGRAGVSARDPALRLPYGRVRRLLCRDCGPTPGQCPSRPA